MDAFKKFTGGNSGAGVNANANTATTNNTTATTSQQDDYGDKGAAYLNKKYMNNKFSHDQLEKMTDAGREGFEKMTGKKVSNKFSN